jgi:hypothetical protein
MNHAGSGLSMQVWPGMNQSEASNVGTLEYQNQSGPTPNYQAGHVPEGQPYGAHLYQDMLDSPISHYYNKPHGEEVKTPGGIHYVDSMNQRVVSSPHEPVDSGMGLNSYSL